MQKDDRLTIKIERMAFGGEGVGRIDNFVVFVPFAASGDELEIVVTELKKKYARGKILKIINPSTLRTEPLCKYYERCGGCCYQHISYAHQLALKKEQVKDAFQKIGKVAAPPVHDTVASPEIYHYRGKAQCHAEKTGTVFNLGFLDISGGRLVDIERCAIMEESINEKLIELRKRLIQQNIKDDRLTIWSDLFTKQGEGQLKRVVKGREFLVPDDGFFQANIFLTDIMVDEACRLAALSPINTLIDVYCGCGLFTLFLSAYAEKIIGIEWNENSIKFARINAEKQNIHNAEFIAGDVEKVLSEAILATGSILDLIILDPPRIGCSARVLQSVGVLKPRRIIYVSCNPATQARDVKILVEYGYTLRSLLPFDMFPQTSHIEVIGLLEYSGKI